MLQVLIQRLIYLGTGDYGEEFVFTFLNYKVNTTQGNTQDSLIRVDFQIRLFPKVVI